MSVAIEPTSVEKSLLLAISIERHNRECYIEWSSRFRTYDSSASILLDELAKEEFCHEEELRATYFKHFHRKAPIDVPVPVEALFFSKELDAIKGHFFIINTFTAQTLLKMALKIERYTQRFYCDLLTKTTDPELSSIYRELGEREDQHEQILIDRLKAEKINLFVSAVENGRYLNDMRI